MSPNVRGFLVGVGATLALGGAVAGIVELQNDARRVRCTYANERVAALKSCWANTKCVIGGADAVAYVNFVDQALANCPK